jgi:hypothetical protein
MLDTRSRAEVSVGAKMQAINLIASWLANQNKTANHYVLVVAV